MGNANVTAYSVDKCNAQMMKVTKEFTLAYTRRQVPVAIYNECTNFMAQLSFSHDLAATPLDTHKCREMTIKYVKEWGYSTEPVDFKAWCQETCEFKYGKKAQQCNIEKLAAEY